MFELLQEEGLTTKKEGGVDRRAAWTHTETSHPGVVTIPGTEHFTPEDYVTRRRGINKPSLNDNDPVVCVCVLALDDKSVVSRRSDYF